MPSKSELIGKLKKVRKLLKDREKQLRGYAKAYKEQAEKMNQLQTINQRLALQASQSERPIKNERET